MATTNSLRCSHAKPDPACTVCATLQSAASRFAKVSPAAISAKATKRVGPCLYLGDKCANPDGSTKTRGCQSCGGKMSQQVLYKCGKNHGQEGEVIAADCNRCSDYQSLKGYFDRIVVINLKRRPDRLEQFKQQVAGWPLAEPAVFEAVDGNLCHPPSTFISGGGAWGCLKSHVAILERALLDGVQKLLVLEDDACVRSTFAEELKRFLLAVPDDWDQLMLGGQHIRTPHQSGIAGVSRCTNCQRTHAYAVRGKYMQELYKLWSACDRHCDHVMGPFQQNWKVYAPDPFLFGQARGRSDITNGNNPTKFWRPPLGTEEVLLLRCDRETVRKLRASGVHTGYRRDAETDVDVGLRDLFLSGKKDGRTNQVAIVNGLRKWVTDLQWECASEENLVLGVWHPEVTEDMLRQCWKGPVRVVEREEDL